MKKLFVKKGGNTVHFDDFTELAAWISEQTPSWSFTVLTADAVRRKKTATRVLTPAESSALSNRVGLAEIMQSNRMGVQQIALTGDVNVTHQLKNWCYLYCRQYNYALCVRTFPESKASLASNSNKRNPPRLTIRPAGYRPPVT